MNTWRQTPLSNEFAGVAEKTDGGCRIKLQSGVTLFSSHGSCTGPVSVGIRPEEISISINDIQPDGNHLKACITRTRFKPSYIETELDAGFPLIAFQPWNHGKSAGFTKGQEVFIHIRPEAVLVFQNSESQGARSSIAL